MAEPCKFFAKGNCAFGNACRYAHIAPPGRSSRPAAAARCIPVEPEKRVDPEDGKPYTLQDLESRYAGMYTADEVKAYWETECSPWVPRPQGPDEGSRAICRFFLSGSCSFGDSCRNLHVVDVAQLDEGLEATVDRAVPSVSRNSQLRPAMGPVGAVDAFDVRSGGPAVPRGETSTCSVEDTECGICFENIGRKGEQFGMLESCDHAFCLSCIRAWRKQREQDKLNLRMCPLCRNESFFVVPCNRLILDPEEKSEAIQDYKREMSKIPCKAFDYGRGKCPFGTSCFYAHLNPDGTRHIPPPKRKMMGREGTQIVGEVKLSDFFG
mmetsp:Transcript_67370/g.161558  ORF Transcript_67370/g.161558 Transcript_67370/m.161558 type:complete len:324 (+) Transcript_67370:72-1043(+)